MFCKQINVHPVSVSIEARQDWDLLKVSFSKGLIGLKCYKQMYCSPNLSRDMTETWWKSQFLKVWYSANLSLFTLSRSQSRRNWDLLAASVSKGFRYLLVRNAADKLVSNQSGSRQDPALLVVSVSKVLLDLQKTFVWIVLRFEFLFSILPIIHTMVSVSIQKPSSGSGLVSIFSQSILNEC